jgi:NTE family protein
MNDSPAALARQYETVALVLQGGGALGSYQAGVFHALDHASIRPSWCAGISIGAINAALIAGNPRETRLEKLRAFWERVSEPSFAPAMDPTGWLRRTAEASPALRSIASLFAAGRALIEGQRGFFRPRLPPPLPGMIAPPEHVSFYDTGELRSTLEEFIDFDRLNCGDVRVSVGAVDVESGNFVFFDTERERLDARHIMASGALPPAFAPIEIDGRYFWDGGIVSNTPLEYVLESIPRRDTLAFQVDLWSARGQLPRRIEDALEREKDIRYSSRTRKGTDSIAARQRLRHAIADALPHLPRDLAASELGRVLEAQACRKRFNVVHLIYRDKAFESHHKDYEFSRETMDEHWRAGIEDAHRTISDPANLALPSDSECVATHDIHRLAAPHAAGLQANGSATRGQ